MAQTGLFSYLESPQSIIRHGKTFRIVRFGTVESSGMNTAVVYEIGMNTGIVPFTFVVRFCLLYQLENVLKALECSSLSIVAWIGTFSIFVNVRLKTDTLSLRGMRFLFDRNLMLFGSEENICMTTFLKVMCQVILKHLERYEKML